MEIGHYSVKVDYSLSLRQAVAAAAYDKAIKWRQMRRFFDKERPVTKRIEVFVIDDSRHIGEVCRKQTNLGRRHIKIVELLAFTSRDQHQDELSNIPVGMSYDSGGEEDDAIIQVRAFRENKLAVLEALSFVEIQVMRPSELAFWSCYVKE